MMKSFITCLFLAVVLLTTSFAQNKSREMTIQEGDTTYNMKEYYICFLKTGPDRDQPKAEADSIQKHHLAHMNKLAKEGKIIIAGPFGDDGDIRGIVIYDVDSLEVAEKYTSHDPAVIAGRLKVECHPWWTAKGSKFP